MPNSGKQVQICNSQEATTILGSKNLCKKACNEKISLAKRFQSAAGEGALTDGKYVRVCKLGRLATNTDAKKLCRDARQKNTVRLPICVRTSRVYQIKPIVISVVRLPNFVRKFSAKNQIPASRLQTSASSEKKYNAEISGSLTERQFV